MADLTTPQRRALNAIASYGPRGRGIAPRTANWAPVRRLIKRQMIRKVKGDCGWPHYALTDAGRAALTNGGGDA